MFVFLLYHFIILKDNELKHVPYNIFLPGSSADSCEVGVGTLWLVWLSHFIVNAFFAVLIFTEV